jgi:hypothetical protein
MEEVYMCECGNTIWVIFNDKISCTSCKKKYKIAAVNSGVEAFEKYKKNYEIED